jgi:hypothetical protein
MYNCKVGTGYDDEDTRVPWLAVLLFNERIYGT